MPEMEKPKPNLESYLVVVGLLIHAVVDLTLLPFRLAVFLVRQKRTKAEISRLIEPGRDP